jgi:hypothetical protein
VTIFSVLQAMIMTLHASLIEKTSNNQIGPYSLRRVEITPKVSNDLIIIMVKQSVWCRMMIGRWYIDRSWIDES